MGFDPIEVSQAVSAVLSNIRKSGTVGYTETKETEILPPTVCPLVGNDGTDSYGPHYDIPRPVDYDGNHEYYLYVDGKEFKYDYDPKYGSGWNGTDYEDLRFTSYFEVIQPGNIAPQTITASIKQVTTIVHPISDKYIHYLHQRVNLLEGILLEKAEYAFEYGNTFVDVPGVTNIVSPGVLLRVHIDGVDYECVVQLNVANPYDLYFFGNVSLLNPDMEDTGEPFCGVIVDEYGMQQIGMIVREEAETSTHTIGITLAVTENKNAPVVIDLDAYGIDIAALAANGGGVIQPDINHNEFWGKIPTNRNVIVRSNPFGADIYATPSYFIVNHGKVLGFGFSITGNISGTLLTMNVIFECSIDDGGIFGDTAVVVAVQQLSIPG